MIASLYVVTGVMIGVSSIHFLCEMKRNFGEGSFEEAKRNVLVIVITVIVCFSYNVIYMSW